MEAIAKILWRQLTAVVQKTSRAGFCATAIGRLEFKLPIIKNGLRIETCETLKNRVYPTYTSVHYSKLKQLHWDNKLLNVFVTKKPNSSNVTAALIKFIGHVNCKYPHINVIVTEEVASEFLTLNDGGGLRVFTGDFDEIINKADLLVTLGGDGTVLKTGSLYADHLVPPVLSFSLGTLGFLLPYDFSNFKDAFDKVYNSHAKVLQRSRLECHVISGGEKLKHHAMNDIVLHRGLVPHLATLDVYIDGEFLTRVSGDGLIVSTPTGSTAYSLSAGGSIVHPLVKCILITPICPRSLSFRPLIIPSTSHIRIKIQPRKKVKRPEELKHQLKSSKLSIDGDSFEKNLEIGSEIHICNEIGTILLPGNHLPDYIIRNSGGISQHQFIARAKAKYGGITSGTIVENEHKGINCVTRSENDWTRGINESLGFNSRFREQVRAVDVDSQ